MLVYERNNELVWFHVMEFFPDSTHVRGFIATMRIFSCGLINIPFFSLLKKIVLSIVSEKRETADN